MRSKKTSRKRGPSSAYMHLWPELEVMPMLDHWPNRPGPYRPESSEVLRFLADSYRCDLEEAARIFQSARSAGVVRFDKRTRKWVGRKGGGS